MQLGGLGSAVSSPSGVWGGAPAEIEFGAFQPKNLTSDGNNFNNFPENQLTKFRAFRDSGRDSVATDDERVAYIQFVPRAG